MQREISADFPFGLKRTRVHDAEMAYVDIVAGDPIVFLNSNPTFSSSYPHEIGEAVTQFVTEVRSAIWSAPTAS